MRAVTAVLITALLTLAVVAAAQPNEELVRVYKEALVHDNYILVKTTISAPFDLTMIKLNISGYSSKLVTAYSEIEGRKVPARLEGDVLVFDLPGVYREVNLVEIYSDLYTYNATHYILIEVPLSLSPIGLDANVTAKIVFPTEAIIEVRPRGLMIERGDVYFMGVVKEGNITVVKAKVPVNTLFLTIESLSRTIIIDNPDYAVFRDNVTILDISGARADYFFYDLPLNVEVIGVSGPLGAYPSRGFVSYSVRETKTGKQVRVRLRAPPMGYGERAFLIIEYKVNLTKTGEGVLVPAYMGVGLLVKNYTVTLKVRGDFSGLSVKPLEIREEGEYKVALLPNAGPLYIGYLENITISELKIQAQVIPLKMVIGVSVLLVIVVGSLFAYLRLERKERVKEKKEQVAATTILSELVDLERKRVESLEGLLDTWDQSFRGKLSWHVYRQRISVLKRREETLRAKADKLLAQAPPDSKERRLAEELNFRIDTFKALLRKLERIERNYRRGLITRREYKARSESLKKTLEEEIDKAYRVIARLEEL